MCHDPACVLMWHVSRSNMCRVYVDVAYVVTWHVTWHVSWCLVSIVRLHVEFSCYLSRRVVMPCVCWCGMCRDVTCVVCCAYVDVAYATMWQVSYRLVCRGSCVCLINWSKLHVDFLLSLTDVSWGGVYVDVACVHDVTCVMCMLMWRVLCPVTWCAWKEGE